MQVAIKGPVSIWECGDKELLEYFELSECTETQMLLLTWI